MRYLLVLCLFLCLYASGTKAQSTFTPVNLGKSVNTEYNELYPVLSPDGQTLYFVRADHPENTYGTKGSQDIWISRLNDDGTWSEAIHAEAPFNTARYNAVLAIPGEGDNLYISGTFTKKLRWKNRGISIVPVLGPHSYGNPKALKIKGFIKKNKGLYTQIGLNGNEDVMILSFSPKWESAQNDLYVSFRQNKKWSKPKKIKSLSSKRIELSPQLSKDSVSRRLYFTTRDNNSKEFSIWESNRLDEKFRKWSMPVRLDNSVNGPLFDGFFNLNKKGSVAYFSSNREGGEGQADLYKVKLFEENPYLELKGIVRHALTDQPLLKDTLVRISINGVPTDSIEINQHNGSYLVLLPLGNLYILQAEKEHYISFPDTFDLRQQKEYLALERDLKLKPVPYVKFYGKIRVKDAKEATALRYPQLLVNGEKADSASIDSAGNYILYLNHGKNYVVTALAENYIPGEERINLRSVHEYDEIGLDLFVQVKPEPKKPEALVTGKIINSKTLKGIDSTVSAQILINDFPLQGVSIKDSVYSLKLPLGSVYELKASADYFYPTLEKIDLSGEKDQVKIFKDLYIAPLEVGSSVKLENIFFETAKATLMKESYVELDRVAQFMRDYPSIKIEIAGYTDNVGSVESNKKLSQERANEVASYLVSQGLSQARITPVGYGMENPIADNNTAEGRQKNRRVEFTILER